MHTLHQCRRIAPSGCSQAAILLPGALDALAQAELYGELCRTTRFTDQWRHLLSDGESPMTARPEPFCVRRWSRSADLAFVSSLLPFLPALFADPEVGGSKRLRRYSSTRTLDRRTHWKSPSSSLQSRAHSRRERPMNCAMMPQRLASVSSASIPSCRCSTQLAAH